MDRRRSLRILLGGEDTSSSSGEERTSRYGAANCFGHCDFLVLDPGEEEDDENRMQVEVLQGHEEEAWLQASIW